MQFQEAITHILGSAKPGKAQMDYRPGRALRRHPNFHELAEAEPQAVHHAAEILGTLLRAGSAIGLTDGARLTLLTLVEHVHSERWRARDPKLWTSNRTLADCRGVEIRTIQRQLSELEDQGWIVRRYTRTHHRAGAGCIDLSPLSCRMTELREAVDEAAAARLLRKSEDRETARTGDRTGAHVASDTLNTEIQPQNLSQREVHALREGVAGSVTAQPESPVSGSAKKTPAPQKFDHARSLIRTAITAAAADPDGYLTAYPTENEGELATALAALAKRRGVAAAWIDQAYIRHGRLGVAARLAAALTLPGAKSFPGLARWMLGDDYRVDPWASLYARARS
jgi:hypothetical protein